MNNVGYIGYKKNTIGFGEATLLTGGTLAPITAIIDIAIASLPFLIPFITNIFQHPAEDTKRAINDLKPNLVSLDPRSRLGLIIATGQKLSNKALDVQADQLLAWYKMYYPNDYKDLLTEDKTYWNNYIMSIRQNTPDGNNLYSNLQRAMFTDSEVLYNANPLQTATTILSSKSNILLYGGIALAIIFLIKK